MNIKSTDKLTKYPIHRLGEIAEIFMGPPVPSKVQRQDDRRYIRTILLNQGPIAVPVIGMKAIDDNKVNTHKIDYYSVRNLKTIEEYKVLPEDLLIQARSTSLNMAIVNENIEEFQNVIINNHVIAIRSEKILPRFLAAYLEHPKGQFLIRSISQSTTLQMNLTIRQLKDMMVPVPPLEIQQKLVKLLKMAESQYTYAIEGAKKRFAIALEIAVSELL